MSIKSQVKTNFGKNAAAYTTSAVHAKGASLNRIIELTQPDASWHVLDIATGAGHAAFAFAPHVTSVLATDLTPEMLEQTAANASERDLANVETQIADAEALPFEDGQFDLVCCRIAPHHFPNVGLFVKESARVLKPAGLFALVDNVVPSTHLRGKIRKETDAAADYINAYEKLRDPSHARALGVHEWQNRIEKAGLTIQHSEMHQKEMGFHGWADRMGVSDANKIRLQAMLKQAPPIAAAYLTPQFANDRITFQLTEAIIIAQKGAAPPQ